MMSNDQSIVNFNLAQIGVRLKFARGAESQAKFATSMDIPLKTYVRYERGERHPGGKTLTRMIDTRGINPNWLLLGIPPVFVLNDEPSLPQARDQISG